MGPFWVHFGVFSPVLLASPFPRRFPTRSGSVRGSPSAAKMNKCMGWVQKINISSPSLRSRFREPSWSRLGSVWGAKLGPKSLPKPLQENLGKHDPQKSPPRGPGDPQRHPSWTPNRPKIGPGPSIKISGPLPGPPWAPLGCPRRSGTPPGPLRDPSGTPPGPSRTPPGPPWDLLGDPSHGPPTESSCTFRPDASSGVQWSF